MSAVKGTMEEGVKKEGRDGGREESGAPNSCLLVVPRQGQLDPEAQGAGAPTGLGWRGREGGHILRSTSLSVPVTLLNWVPSF